MATDNPYPFDNDKYQRATVSLNYHVREAWRAGASEDQIKSTLDEVFATIEASEDGSIPATTEPDFVSDPPSGVAEERETEAVEAEEEGTADEPEGDAEEPTPEDEDALPGDETIEEAVPAPEADETNVEEGDAAVTGEQPVDTTAEEEQEWTPDSKVEEPEGSEQATTSTPASV